jgi:hypothetical protein
VAHRGQVTVVEPGSSSPGEAVPASVEVAEDSITIVPERGDPVTLAYIDVDDVFDDDYTLRLTDFAGRRYDLSMMGKAYGQVLADVRSRRDDLLQHHLLLTGVSLQDTFPARLFPGGAAEPVPCEVRLFEDLMVVVPERGVMWGLPYSFVENVRFDEELYQTHVATDDGSEHVFGMMGKRSEEFHGELRRLLDALAARTARTLGQLVPGLEPAVLSRLAARMRDGRAVQQREVDTVAPSAWPRLVDAVVGTPDLRATFDRLASTCPPGWAALGVKAVLAEEEEALSGAAGGEAWEKAEGGTSREAHLDHVRDQQGASRAEAGARQAGMPPGAGGLLSQMQDQMAGAASAAAAEAASEAAKAAVAEAMARMPGGQPAAAPEGGVGAAPAEGSDGVPGITEDEEGRDRTILWFFAPLAEGGRPLNAAAQEITSEQGHATYVFRLMAPEQFEAARAAGDEALAGAVAAALARLNRALLTLNFRREPIYLTDEQIATGRYAKYRTALRKLDYLRWTRSAFLGRAIHNETWERQVRDLAAKA